MADFFSNGYGSGLIGGALGMVGGAIQYNRQKKLMAQQYQYALGMAQQNQQYAKEMAGINQGYAKEMAGINQQHNKDMFDYTGYQAQIAQMKADRDNSKPCGYFHNKIMDTGKQFRYSSTQTRSKNRRRKRDVLEHGIQRRENGVT